MSLKKAFLLASTGLILLGASGCTVKRTSSSSWSSSSSTSYHNGFTGESTYESERSSSKSSTRTLTEKVCNYDKKTGEEKDCFNVTTTETFNSESHSTYKSKGNHVHYRRGHMYIFPGNRHYGYNHNSRQFKVAKKCYMGGNGQIVCK